MEGKTVLITGCNSGIGKETANQLAEKGAKIIMACRNLDKANAARDEIIKKTGNQNIVVMQIDLSSFESIRIFAKQFLSMEQRLDVLIHNAGYGGYSRKVSQDGLELTYAINHYGPFLLTHLLINILKKSAPSRIVVVASDVYRYASVDIRNLNPIDSRLVWYLYYSTKGLNIMFTQELARCLEGSNITVNCLHPGYVHTPLWHRLPKLMWIPTNFLYKTFGKTPKEGAECSVYLASSDEVKNISGKYFKDCKVTELKPHITDVEKCKILWQESTKLVKIQPDDPQI